MISLYSLHENGLLNKMGGIEMNGGAPWCCQFVEGKLWVGMQAEKEVKCFSVSDNGKVSW